MNYSVCDSVLTGGESGVSSLRGGDGKRTTKIKPVCICYPTLHLRVRDFLKCGISLLINLWTKLLFQRTNLHVFHYTMCCCAIWPTGVPV